ncbi:8-oxoguanine DNA glycosylase OGG fold protein [Micromonospora sp. S4605]|uniref:8-oxoguanine DNA glycosylase OGG fold protein n=1 Tax=Micromonospora sp. S4605 TaxID=1420897 RepID=UPI0011B557E4|nr:hypothetical protein [Micromonospora sp. S4605]
MTIHMPPALPVLVAGYHGEYQGPVAYIVASWQTALSRWPEEASVLIDDRWTRSACTSGRRMVTRHDIRKLIAVTDLADPLGVRKAFVLVMTWGSGVTNTRSYRNAARALADQNGAEMLAATAMLCREGRLDEAYRRFSLPGVGRSFFTKWFAFAGRTKERPRQPLILDDRVLRTLNRTLRISTVELANTRLRSRRYQAYVEHLYLWTHSLREAGIECSAERLEWILFSHNGADLPIM